MARDADERLLATGAGERVAFGLTQDSSAEAIGDDQALILGQKLLWEVFGNTEVKSIAILAILGPFLVDVEIRSTRLHLYHDDLALFVEAGHVGAPSVGEGELQHGGVAHVAKDAHNAAGDRLGHLGTGIALANAWGGFFGGGVVAQPWNSGILTLMPSSALETPTWQERREVSWRSEAKSSIDSSIGEASPAASLKAGST